jgi:hypothetical protein
MADIRQQIPDEIVKLASTTPVATDQALVVALSPNSAPFTQLDTNITGTITATDILCPAPAGLGQLVSTAPTVGSFVAALVPGATAQADIQITGTATGTYYFEGSMDSTTGSDGSWAAVNYRQTGITNTVLGYSAIATNAVYRGAPSGFKYIRLRNVGGTAPSNAIIFRYSNGGGTTFLNASIPAGTNNIGVINVASNQTPITVQQNDSTSTGNITTQNLNPNTGVATTGSVIALTGPLSGVSTVSIQVTGTYTGALTPQCSLDNVNWITMGSTALINVTTNAYSGTIPSASQQIYQADIAGFPYFRISANNAMTGTAVTTLRATNATGMVGIDNPLPTGTNTVGSVNVATKTIGGTTTFTLISAASTNATNVKTSAGSVYSLQASNTGASVAFLKLYNTNAALTVGSSVAVKTLILPAGGGTNVMFTDIGAAFTVGIALAITGFATTADTTAVALAQVVVNVDYA